MKSPFEYLKNTVKHDSFDHRKIVQLVTQTDLGKDVRLGSRSYDQFPELLEDIFYSLYKHSVRIYPKTEISPTYMLNHHLITKLLEDPDYEKVRANTRMDVSNAALGAASLAARILEENTDLFKRIKDMEKQKQHLQTLSDQQTNGSNPHRNKIRQKYLDQINQLQQQQSKLLDTIDINGAVQATGNQIGIQDNILSNLGFGNQEGHGTQTQNFQEKLEFSKLYLENENFRKVAQLIGRFRRMAHKKQKFKTKQNPEELTDIHLSDELCRMLPTEYAGLAIPELKPIFAVKFSEHRLITYEFKGYDPKAKGDMVICLDVSISMEGVPDAMAKAVAMGLVEIAHRQKRNAHILLFDVIVHSVWDFPRKEPYWQKLRELADTFPGGGTSFNAPIRRSMEIIEANPHNNADIVFVTDGCGAFDRQLRSQFMTFKTEKEVSLYTILVGFQGNHILEPYSDFFRSVDSILEAAPDLFSAI